MKKKQSKKDFLREWGFPEKYQYQNLRYKSPPEKGVLWYFFSLFIRNRDVEKYGTCISCGKPITVETSQAGHFAPASICGRDMLFDEINVQAECPGCNGFDSMHLLGFAENLDKRYGAGTALELRRRRDENKKRITPLKDYSRAEYSQKIKDIKKRLN